MSVSTPFSKYSRKPALKIGTEIGAPLGLARGEIDRFLACLPLLGGDSVSFLEEEEDDDDELDDDELLLLLESFLRRGGGDVVAAAAAAAAAGVIVTSVEEAAFDEDGVELVADVVALAAVDVVLVLVVVVVQAAALLLELDEATTTGGGNVGPWEVMTGCETVGETDTLAAVAKVEEDDDEAVVVVVAAGSMPALTLTRTVRECGSVRGERVSEGMKVHDRRASTESARGTSAFFAFRFFSCVIAFCCSRACVPACCACAARALVREAEIYRLDTRHSSSSNNRQQQQQQL